MPLACRSMKLQGMTMETAMGQRVTIKYNEGGAELIEYGGAVTFAEASRQNVPSIALRSCSL